MRAAIIDYTQATISRADTTGCVPLERVIGVHADDAIKARRAWEDTYQRLAARYVDSRTHDDR